jgi:hypothetical protein
MANIPVPVGLLTGPCFAATCTFLEWYGCEAMGERVLFATWGQR